MTEQAVIDLGVKSAWVAIQIASPALVAILVTGLVISIIQAATQINEQTMSFIPKVLAMTIAMMVFGSWILKVIMEFSTLIIAGIPDITHGKF